VAAFVVILGMGALYFAFSGGDGQVVDQTTVPTPTTLESPFLDTWVSIDSDGSTPTMMIEVSENGTVGITVHDDPASVCSGAPSTMSGAGGFEGDSELIIPTPILTCDDGSQPEALSGPPLEEQLRNLTFVHDPESDTLTDNFGSVWTREGAEDPGPEPTVSTDMWPQTNLEEVREAQELADAGDSDYTWQLDATLAADGEPWGAEIFTRFIEEELGWEASAGFGGYLYVDGGGRYESVLFIRCAPGQTNPLNPLYAEAPPEIRRCAPTIDELSYETVGISVTQPGVRGPSGIWVVNGWETFHPKSAESLWDLLHPDFLAETQVEQVVPPSEAEVNGLLEAFLRARVDGEGAEQYLLREPEESSPIFEDTDVPLLYATTSGAPYERSDIEKVQGPVWPTGWMEYKIRLFAEGGTVVEQLFHVVRHDGQLGLVYGDADIPTTENGQSVPLPYSILDGEVTFAAAPPWEKRDWPSDTFMKFNGSRDDHVVIATDPLPVGTGCDPAPADAEALARRIMADPNIDTTETVPVRIAGLEGLQMDVDVNVNAVFRAEEDYSCSWIWAPDQADRWRMRLYLVDLPEGISMQTLAIAVIAAPDTDFERVLEEASPIVESLEIHTR
jgi:hypothetical protein